VVAHTASRLSSFLSETDIDIQERELACIRLFGNGREEKRTLQTPEGIVIVTVAAKIDRRQACTQVQIVAQTIRETACEWLCTLTPII